jgi:hypothetical protein
MKFLRGLFMISENQYNRNTDSLLNRTLKYKLEWYMQLTEKFSMV